MSAHGLPKSMAQRLCCLEKESRELRAEVEELNARIGYIPMAITSFTAAPSTVEIGSTVSSVFFSWVLNKPAATQDISPVVGSVPPPATSVNAAVSLTSSTTFTLTADDGTVFPGHSAVRTASVQFLHKAYWGTSASSTLPDSAAILALGGSAFASSRARSFTVDGNGQYIYYAYPASFGDAAFSVNGFPTAGWVKTQVSFTNASGNTTLFNVFRSAAVQSGTGILITAT